MSRQITFNWLTELFQSHTVEDLALFLRASSLHCSELDFRHTLVIGLLGEQHFPF